MNYRVSKSVPSTNIKAVHWVYCLPALIVLRNVCICSGCRKRSCWHMRNETEQHILQMYLFILLGVRAVLHSNTINVSGTNNHTAK